MPTKTKKISGARSSKSHAHPSNKHQPKHFVKVYWPYIPLIALVITGLVGGVGFRPNNVTPTRAVLAYASEMSQGGLLASTNAERTNHGIAALSINSKLNQAAQAKANDMVARDYWSHNTPDGQAPWTFISNAGYSYQKAGENLAYGFSSSNETIVGWMNSPGHKANILDSGYKEVGFGFANSPNYVGTGEETVVVAMYANPQVLASEAPAPAPAPKPAAVAPTPTPAAAAQPEPEVVAQAPAEAEPTPEQFSSDTSDGTEPEPARITRLQSLTGGRAPWSAVALSSLSIIIVGLWLLKHALIIKRAMVTGEKFVLHHPIIDISVAAFIALAIVLSSSSGLIR